MELTLPKLLRDLVSNGIWPADADQARQQHLQALVAPVRVRLFAADEEFIFLQPPPFHTIEDWIALGGSSRSFSQEFGALEQIVPSRAMIIGDFGLGSDSPIFLNYVRCAVEPPVYRLRWVPGARNQWVEGAANFAEFVGMLGLGGSVA